jgi:hypothetical protein
MSIMTYEDLLVKIEKLQARLAVAEKVCQAVKVGIRLLNMSVSGEVRSVLEEWQAAVETDK